MGLLVTPESDLREPALPSGFQWIASLAAEEAESPGDPPPRAATAWDARREGRAGPGFLSRSGEDLSLAASLGLDAVRLSVSWARVVKERAAKPSAQALEAYSLVVDRALARGLSVLLTLHQWDLPAWQAERGGWADADAAKRLADLAEAVAAAMGDRAGTILTLHEPGWHALHAHALGLHPPFERDGARTVAALEHLARAHALAAQAVRAASRQPVRVGLAVTSAPALPASAADRPAARALDSLVLDAWLRAARGSDSPPPEGLPFELARAAAAVQSLARAPADLLVVECRPPLDVAVSSGPLGLLLGLSSGAPELPLAARVAEVAGAFAPEAPPPLVLGTRCLLPRLAADERLRSDRRVLDEARVDALARWHAELRRLPPAPRVEGWIVGSLLDGFAFEHGWTRRGGLVHVEEGSLDRIPKASARSLEALRSG